MNIIIDPNKQKLFLYNDDQLLLSYDVSTSRSGLGEKEGSFKTPRGLHEVCEKIGHGAMINSVFVGRRLTGEIYSAILAAKEPNRDWILTRILRLSGLEPGKNQGGNVDTLKRMIYIHGTPESEPMDQPLSHGCIRMRNKDIIELFDLVLTGTKVLIHPG